MSDDPHAHLSALLPRMVAFARTMLNDIDRAHDLAQEAATRALAARRVPEDARAYRAWLFQIVRNAALDEIRRMRVAPTPEPPAPDLWGYENANIAKITVEQGLSSLAPQHREIIAMVDIAGFTYAEAAELMDVPIGTVMSRITRARGALLSAIATSTVRPLKSRHGN